MMLSFHLQQRTSRASLRAYFYEALSAVLRPYVGIALCHCRDRSLSELPPGSVEPCGFISYVSCSISDIILDLTSFRHTGNVFTFVELHRCSQLAYALAERQQGVLTRVRLSDMLASIISALHTRDSISLSWTIFVRN
jgi:hypothetical protein